MKKLLITILFIFALTDTSYSAVQQPHHDISPDKFESLIRSSKAEYKILFIFSSWCKICKRDFPEFIKLHNKYSSHGVEFIPISFDEKPDQLENYLNKHSLDNMKVYRFKYKNIYEVAISFNKLGIKYSGAIPHIVLLKSNNEIIADGNFQISAFDEGLEMLLKEK